MPSTPATAEENRAAIETFLKQCREPSLLEPGEDLLPLNEQNVTLDVRGDRLTLQAWDRTRNLTRRVTSLGESTPARLEVMVERFAKRQGKLFLLDLARRSGADLGKRSGRLIFRERFRLFLRRQFTDWKLLEISAEADLENSLSPAFPRAWMRRGPQSWAAIACPPEGDPGAVLSFGLIWLDYLRRRERRSAVEGLAIYVPAGMERATALRLLCLDSRAARFQLFSYAEDDEIAPIDAQDHGNLETRLETCRRPPVDRSGLWQAVARLPGVEEVAKHDGRSSLRVRGLEFAEVESGELRFGIDGRRPAREHHLGEIERLVEELARVRGPDADREHPLYRQYPEAWLESMARAEVETLYASLARPIYGQVPAFAGGERGVLDLLAADRHGRLTVVELKASADLHLPLQATDYWIRVKWHLDRGDFQRHGYFPGVELLPDPPRLLLVSPSLEFHPTTETILSYFSQAIEVERIGLAVEWRKGLRVMFRFAGAQRPQ